MAAAFTFAHRIEFRPQQADEILRTIPAAPGILALRGVDENSEPYLTRTADLRRRLRRLLAPPEALNEDGTPVLSKRLNLRNRVRFIDYTRTGSDFESTLALYCATRIAFGNAEARRRLRLYSPYFLRITLQHAHPRVYATNKLSRRSLPESFGPFPSRIAAERYADAVLDLFKLRRCHEDLQVHPDHPGCAYGEMKKCSEPCKGICTSDDYATEAAAVHAFFATRGESMLFAVAQQREAASEAMDFEAAAALHKQWEKVRAAAALADELIRPIPQLRVVILQEAAPQATEAREGAGDFSPLNQQTNQPGFSPGPAKTTALEDHPESAAVFLLEHGRITGPQRLSTLGVRAVREQTAVGSSLFAQPLMLAAVPLDESATNPGAPSLPEVLSPVRVGTGEAGAATAPTTSSLLSPEDRARAVLHHLHELASHDTPLDETCDFLSLFRRWYYRPEKQRKGEVFLPNPDGSWPVRRILNGAARVALGPPAQLDAVNREAAREALKAVKTKVIHEGREGVERVVPVLPKRARTRKAVTPAELKN